MEWAIVDGELANSKEEIMNFIKGAVSDFMLKAEGKVYGDKTVFQETAFIIHDLDRIGLIGVKRDGKTTLLDVLSGKIRL